MPKNRIGKPTLTGRPDTFVCEGERTGAKISENVEARGSLPAIFVPARGDWDRRGTAAAGEADRKRTAWS
jgi:hypothetical protein